METRKDAYTSESFVPKRINQRFALGVNRIAFHNATAKIDRHKRAIIERPLIKNCRILTKAIGKNKTVRLHHEYLRALDYDFTVLTGYERVEGKIIASIYQFTIEQDASDTQYYIIKISNE